MPFIDDILNYDSLSIVGLEKNTGKTTCLNYVLKEMHKRGKKIAVTSIGIDGENVDQVKGTHKPEIEIYDGMYFVTSEKHYHQRKVISEIVDLSSKRTSLGRLVTAKSISTGKIVFSGPTDTFWLKEIIRELELYKLDATIVDGALSRLSLGSPAVTQSMILTTGAALSANMKQLVKKTSFVHTLINLEEFETKDKESLLKKEQGIWAIDKLGNVQSLDIPSVFLLEKNKDRLFQYGNRIFVSGMISDKLLNFLRVQKNIGDIELIVKDFSKIFISHETFHQFVKSGGKIKVLLKTNLIAVCVNPVSPEGYKLNSNQLCAELQEKLNIPVYDIKRI